MNDLVWLFGRGASIACGLRWSVPDEWLRLEREELVSRIREALSDEIGRPGISPLPYRRLLTDLAQRTMPDKRHLFITTNWDDLLDREVDSLPGEYAPVWLPETHVFHLNGTISSTSDRRSRIALEQDPAGLREQSLELDVAIAAITWCRRFVVVGMSFACAADRELLHFLHSIRNQMPVGYSRWIVVNPEANAADAVVSAVEGALPNSRARRVYATLQGWLDLGMPELVDAGILQPAR